MKRAVSIICVAALLLSVVALAGCGLNGKYQLVEIIGSNGSVETGTVASLTVKGNVATLTYGTSATYTYVIDKKTKTINVNGEFGTYQQKGKRLTVFLGGNQYIFEK